MCKHIYIQYCLNSELIICYDQMVGQFPEHGMYLIKI